MEVLELRPFRDNRGLGKAVVALVPTPQAEAAAPPRRPKLSVKAPRHLVAAATEAEPSKQAAARLLRAAPSRRKNSRGSKTEASPLNPTSAT